MRKRLLIFTRYPEAGRVKTRLIPLLGSQDATRLHRRLVTHTLACASVLQAQHSVGVEVHFDGGDRDLMATCFGDHFCYVHQASGDLGAKLTVATSSANQPTVVIGTDCPELNAEAMQRAFQALQSTDVVLGPASDGGYYLIGLKEPQPALFSDIPWGTDRVCQLTQQLAQDQGLSVHLLEVLDDIDRPTDFRRLDRGLREALLGAD